MVSWLNQSYLPSLKVSIPSERHLFNTTCISSSSRYPEAFTSHSSYSKSTWRRLLAERASMRAYKHSNKPRPGYHEWAFNWEKDLVTYFAWFCLWCALYHDSEHARQTNKRLRLSCIMQYSLHNRCYFLAFFRQAKAIAWRAWSARHARRECNRKLQLNTLFILAIRSSSVSIYEALTKRTRSSNTDLYWKNQIQSNQCYAAILIKEWSYGATTEVCFLKKVRQNLTKEVSKITFYLGIHGSKCKAYALCQGSLAQDLRFARFCLWFAPNACSMIGQLTSFNFTIEKFSYGADFPNNYKARGWGKSFFFFFFQRNDIRNQNSTPFEILMESTRKNRAIPNVLDWNISKKLLQQMYKLRLIQWVFIKCRSLSCWFGPGQRTGWCLCVFVIGHLIID